MINVDDRFVINSSSNHELAGLMAKAISITEHKDKTVVVFEESRNGYIDCIVLTDGAISLLNLEEEIEFIIDEERRKCTSKEIAEYLVKEFNITKK